MGHLPSFWLVVPLVAFLSSGIGWLALRRYPARSDEIYRRIERELPAEEARADRLLRRYEL